MRCCPKPKPQANPHQVVVGQHALNAEREGDCHCKRQALWHRHDKDGDAGNKEVEVVLQRVGGIRAVRVVSARLEGSCLDSVAL